MPLIIALTGGIATGKSTVSVIWRRAGVQVIDADAVARSVVLPGRLAHRLIRLSFGPSVFHPDNTLNRPALGRLIFATPSARSRLDAITHPLITLSMLTALARALLARSSVVVLDTPLLFETRVLVPFCSTVVVVRCAEAQQLDRLRTRDAALSEGEARARIGAQMPLDDKVRRVGFVLDNGGSVQRLERDALELLERLKPSDRAERAVQAAVGAATLGLCAVAACAFFKYYGIV